MRVLVRRAAQILRLALILPLPIAFRLYGTDKAFHGYGNLYARWFRGLRWRRFTLVEIGVFHGASLRVWRDRFPRAQILGVDISPPDIRLGRRVRVRTGNQAVAEHLTEALAGVKTLDVVIDDGSHRGEDIWATFQHLFPLMPSGGIYIIEDLSTSYWADYGGGIPAPDESAVGLARALIDAVQVRAPIHHRRGGPTSGHPAPTSAFPSVGAVHVLPNALVIERA